MILVFLALFIVFTAGYSISRFFLGDKISKIEIIPVSFIIGSVFMSYSVLFSSLISGNIRTGVYSFLIVGGIYCAYFINKNLTLFIYWISKRKIDLFFRKNNQWPAIIFVILFTVLFFDIFSKTAVFQDGAYKGAIAGYGDIPFHMTQMSYFIHNKPFGLEEPIYAGTGLAYSFLINLLSASFYVLSGNYIFSFNFPALLLILSAITLTYFLISKLVKSVFAQISAFLIFFLGSGIGYFKILNDGSLWAKKNLGEVINYILHLPYPISSYYDQIYPSQNNIWPDFLTMFLMHQRAFFFGFAAGILNIFLIFLAIRNKNIRIFYLSGILIGLLPLIHTHTFIAILLINIGFLTWAVVIKNQFLIRNLFHSTAIGSIIGFCIGYFFIIRQSISQNLLTFRLGWMTEPGGLGSIQYNPASNIHIAEIISFIWQNFGFIFPLIIISSVYLILKKKKEENLEVALILCSAIILLVVNLIKFQPWDYDNNKIFAYFLLVSSILIGRFFDRLRFVGAKLVIILITFLIIFGGLIDVFSRSSLASPPLYELFNRQDQIVADWILKNTSSPETILTGSYHLNPVDSLAGKPVLMGYAGWLWTRGIDYTKRENDIKKIFAGDIDAKILIKKYNINYVMIGPKEKSVFYVNADFFAKNYPVVFQLDDTKIYKISD